MKIQSYNKFWQRIHNLAKEKGFPLRVMFELTYRCNFHCKHCYVPQSYKKEKGELKTKEVFSILKQLKDIGCFYLGFTGGEPFMRKDILDILWYAKRCGFEVIIYTNGSLINKAMAIQLKRLRPNKVDITIPAMSKENFERITQMPGSHKKVFGAIDFLYKKRVNLGFKTCVLKENEDEIKDIQDFAATLGALHRLDDMLSPRLDGSKEPYKYRGKLLNNANIRKSNANSRKCLNANSRECLNANLRQSNANSRECLNEDISVNLRAMPNVVTQKCVASASRSYSLRRVTSFGISENSRLFKCRVGVGQVAITPFGELKMCVMIDYPKYRIMGAEDRKTRIYANLTRMDANKYSRELTFPPKADPPTAEDSRGFALKDAWQSLKQLVASIKPDENYKCNECELQLYCNWCPAKAWLENKSFTICDPESRRWAEIRSQKIE